MKQKNMFFMEFFNDIFKVNDDEVMIVFDVEGNIWFKFKDLLKVLGYTGTLKHSNKIKIDDTNMILYKNIKVPQYSTVYQKCIILLLYNKIIFS